MVNYYIHLLRQNLVYKGSKMKYQASYIKASAEPAMTTSITDATISSMQGVQVMLSALTTLSLTDWHFPPTVELNDGDIFDFVVVGSGTGGSTVASRLTEDGTTTVALIEAGGIPPLESLLTGLFPSLTNSKNDWNITSVPSSIANKCLQNGIVEITSGQMLGGSSSLDHAIRVLANSYDMDRFVNATGDDSYSMDNMLKYYLRSESLCDEEIMAKYPQYHGTDGPLIVKRLMSDRNTKILESFKEAGHEIILDINPDSTVGYNEPLMLIGNEWRQSAAKGYLGRAKNLTNLFVQINAMVTKIIINSDKVATGVQFLSNGVYKTIYARKEVIVSCGALKTPQLLMLSGIGNKSHLEDFGLEVIADLPVGDKLSDHLSASVMITLEESNKTTVTNPSDFPVPMTTGYVSLDGTKDPTYQAINLDFGPGHAGLLQLCVMVFKYNNTVCNAMYKANIKRAAMFSVVNVLHPDSYGTVRLNSVDPTVNPTVDLGHLSNPNDLVTLGKSLKDFVSVVNTSHFKDMGSEIVEIPLTECEDLDRNSVDYWECYGKWMSAGMWHSSSTCAVGTVLENDMTVKGIENLRVVDASAMPDTVSGNIISTVSAMAEKAVDHIKTKWSLS